MTVAAVHNADAEKDVVGQGKRKSDQGIAYVTDHSIN